MESQISIDELDLKIISQLQKDSRQSFQQLADKLGIAVGTAYNRVKRLEENKVIKKYSAVIDPAKIGVSLTALVLVQAEGSHIIDLEKVLAKMEEAVAVYDITGDFDIAVVARFKDTKELNSFVKRLLGMAYVKRTVTDVMLNVVKEDFTLPAF